MAHPGEMRGLWRLDWKEGGVVSDYYCERLRGVAKR